MPRKDLHQKPFDEATLTKLEIFERYLEEWLPVFLYTPYQGDLQIWDLFAGQGYDIKGQKGSPVRIIDTLKKYESSILEKGKTIRIVLNEYDKNKFELLKTCIASCQKDLTSIKHLIKFEFFNLEFQKLYAIQYEQLQKGNSILFLDQNGVKEITEKVFLELASFPRTDFLFFISSSYFSRFADDFKKIHAKLDVEEIRKSKFKHLHLAVLNLYKTYLHEAKNTDSFLFPFSILKPTSSGYNIYGLIFCAKHVLAASKFLTIAWDKNKINGQANYDIEEDKSVGQIDMFTGERKPTKIEKFQTSLSDEILNNRIKTNIEAFIYTLTQGHIPSHAEELLSKLKSQGKIEWKGRTGISYNAYKDNTVVEYKTKTK